MTLAQYKIGQEVHYTNGGPAIYTGQIVKIKDRSLIVVSCDAGLILWNAGCSIGTEITLNQVK